MPHSQEYSRTNRPARHACLLIAIGSLLCAPLHADKARAAPVRGDVPYTVQPGDTLSQIAGSQMGSAAEWKRLQRRNRIDNPNVLTPGSTIYLPAVRGGVAPVEAEAILVKGEVRFQRSVGGPVTALTLGTRLTDGSLIETGPTGLLMLRFTDGSRMLVSPDSRLTLKQMSLDSKSGAAVTRATLETGDIESFVTRLRGIKARYEVTTPTLNLAVRGTAFRAQFDALAGEARTSVTEGEVKAANGYGETSVPAGTGTIAAAGGPPAIPRPLLPPPALGERLVTVDAFPLRIDWQALPGAQHYRFELHEGGGSDDRLAQMAVVDDTAARWQRLANGEYRLRVHGVDALKLDGKNAELAFKVQAWPSPPLAAVPAEGMVLAADRVKIRWARSAEAEYLHFQVATDDAFQQLVIDIQKLTGRSNGLTIPLPPGSYFWRIAAGNTADGHGPFGPIQTFAVDSARGYVDERARLLHWNRSSPGERYNVQIARQDDFAKPLLDTELGEARVAIPEGEGPLYVRIMRSAPDGFGGEYEAAQVFDPQD